ncbi:SHOCT domain-containing protein [Spongiactinospora sp. TRM90649]|uniref:SHOCT domain-containing protein n=1 Tax=Spongiactinospora sp. TRM90649 TaxID=3031114 RepID=UPI0023F87363|nr:SHOCT domain-containing protein [Spongiactinospora sp. TRM90649]MDF5757209.1 SHOCT domain-containing protein [Spongiactinospora sp. TRM90649]
MNTLAMAPHWGGGFWPIFPVFWLVFWAAAVTLFVRARRRGWKPPFLATATGSPSGPTDAAERLLAERYARGEMSDDEYLQRVSVLKTGSS